MRNRLAVAGIDHPRSRIIRRTLLVRNNPLEAPAVDDRRMLTRVEMLVAMDVAERDIVPDRIGQDA